jgi:hypothetical protein
MWRSVEDQARLTLWSYIRSASPAEAGAAERLLQAFGIGKPPAPAPAARPKGAAPTTTVEPGRKPARRTGRAVTQPLPDAGKRARAARRDANGAKAGKA